MIKEHCKAYSKEWYQKHIELEKAKMKAWRLAHKDYQKAYSKAWKKVHKDYQKAYYKLEVNSQGQSKSNIRTKSRYILKQMNLKIPEYEIHHCFGYEDPRKFIYISKSLHLKIHKYLRDNHIDADTNHWMTIRDIVNDTDEFTYIKC